MGKLTVRTVVALPPDVRGRADEFCKTRGKSLTSVVAPALPLYMAVHDLLARYCEESMRDLVEVTTWAITAYLNDQEAGMPNSDTGPNVYVTTQVRSAIDSSLRRRILRYLTRDQCLYHHARSMIKLLREYGQYALVSTPGQI